MKSVNFFFAIQLKRSNILNFSFHIYFLKFFNSINALLINKKKCVHLFKYIMAYCLFMLNCLPVQWQLRCTWETWNVWPLRHLSVNNLDLRIKIITNFLLLSVAHTNTIKIKKDVKIHNSYFPWIFSVIWHFAFDCSIRRLYRQCWKKTNHIK